MFLHKIALQDVPQLPLVCTIYTGKCKYKMQGVQQKRGRGCWEIRLGCT